MKYYLFYEDDILEKILDIVEVEKENKDLFIKIMCENFGTWKSWALSYDFEYQSVYEIETSLKKEELKKVLIQDFYIDTLEVAKVLGKVKKII